MFSRRKVSQDGYEMTFAVNHLAPFLLTHLLLSSLQGGKPARIVTTSSEAHRRATLQLEPKGASNYSAMRAYGSSKLANILFTRSLARRLQGTSVTATCLHPGFVRTSFGRDMSSVGRVIFALFARFARSPEKGAQTIVYLASAAQVEGASGGYYFDCKLTRPSAAAQDDTAAEELWKLSERWVGINPR